MAEKEQLIFHSYKNSGFFVTKQPSLCPFCKRVFSPIAIGETEGVIFTDKTKTTFLIFQCQHCKKIGVGEYEHIDTASYGRPIYQPIGSDYFFPKETFAPKDFDKAVKDNFPEFVSAYHQAEKAQQIGCEDLAGMGYRKAAEILIKDFAILSNPHADNKIQKLGVSDVINQFFSFDRDFWKMAQGVWTLGNDYSHYKKKYEDKDISFLKKVLDLLCAEVIKKSLLNDLTPVVAGKEINLKQ